MLLIFSDHLLLECLIFPPNFCPRDIHGDHLSTYPTTCPRSYFNAPSAQSFTLTKIDVSEDTVECIWRSSHFRAAIRRKFEEVIVADNSNADSRAIEEQLFAKVKTIDLAHYFKVGASLTGSSKRKMMSQLCQPTPI